MNAYILFMLGFVVGLFLLMRIFKKQTSKD
jgi:uncharacterized protein YneF (UPF0154 family)